MGLLLTQALEHETTLMIGFTQLSRQMACAALFACLSLNSGAAGTSLQQLRNGNVLVGNFLRGQEGKGAHAFEVTRDKKVVWKWENHDLVKSLTTVRVVDR